MFILVWHLLDSGEVNSKSITPHMATFKNTSCKSSKCVISVFNLNLTNDKTFNLITFFFGHLTPPLAPLPSSGLVHYCHLLR